MTNLTSSIQVSEEMVEAGAAALSEASNPFHFDGKKAVTAIYLVMRSKDHSIAADDVRERVALRERVRDYIYDCTRDEFGNGWTLSAHQTDDLIAMVTAIGSQSK